MKRWELVLLALFLACWLVYLLAVFQVVAPEGTLDLGFYPYYSIAVAAGWGAGNLYVYRSRDLDPQSPSRRRLLAGYFLAPLGLILLLKAMTPLVFQRGAPLVGLYAFCIFSIFFYVATRLNMFGRRLG
ncbi:MAG TPA: hypothetical protein VN493_23810 [Thermoanaerobaculia bacterium]|nr:hypothetical protein [Thermoanaerobaculia bacterium]